MSYENLEKQPFKKKSNRIHYLDAMRGMLILSIVMIHTLQVYNPEHTWLIYSEKGMIWVPDAIKLLMLFALPSFFIMSGYFAALSIYHHGTERFFESRLKRIVIPIISAAVTLNSVQTYLLVKNGRMHFELWDYISHGEWISHLWFLIDLTVFLFLSYLYVKYFSKHLRKIAAWIEKYIPRINIYVILVMFVFLTVVLLALFSIFSAYLNNPILNIRSLLFYLPFFLLGALMWRYEAVYKKILDLHFLPILIIIALTFFSSQHLIGYEEKFYRFAYYFLDTSAHLFASILCFMLFYRFVNKYVSWIEKLSDASYSIYLFHHLFVVAVGLLLIRFGIDGYIGVPVLFVSAVGISLFIHNMLISKIPLFGFLFNGKKLIKKREKSVE